jgi:hypothetical protein
MVCTELFTFAAMIDHATIERILDSAEISDVVSDFVTLRKRGVNMLGMCRLLFLLPKGFLNVLVVGKGVIR